MAKNRLRAVLWEILRRSYHDWDSASSLLGLPAAAVAVVVLFWSDSRRADAWQANVALAVLIALCVFFVTLVLAITPIRMLMDRDDEPDRQRAQLKAQRLQDRTMRLREQLQGTYGRHGEQSAADEKFVAIRDSEVSRLLAEIRSFAANDPIWQEHLAEVTDQDVKMFHKPEELIDFLMLTANGLGHLYMMISGQRPGLLG